MEGSGHAAVHAALAPARPIRARLVLTVSGFGVLALVVCVLAPLVGSTPINLRRALDPSLPFASNVDAQILFIARLPRVLAGALVGAALASSGVYALANSPRRAMSTTVLLLAGVTLNAFFSALILFVQYLADFAEVYRATRWLMGDLDVGGFDPIVAALPLIIVATVIFARLPAALNLM